MSNELIRQMQAPSFYAHNVTAPIQVVQTHISFVILTGPFAYKIKKPVDLGFLDFSSLALRKHYCEEELRLNRRFAPRLYLDVLPVYESGGRYSFDAPSGEAEPVEYVLQMRQFREEDLLTHCLERGELTEDHMRTVAEKMVKAHARAETNEYIAGFGAPDRIRAIMDDNFAITRRYADRTISDEQLAAMESGIYGVLDRDRDLLDARSREGCTRECHGDLHLRNMCWFEGEIQFFDCIEFNEQYRFIDVMYELAFLAMDLEYRGAPALANVLINTYLEHSGDYSGAALLPMYMAVRGLVRGNVSSILLDEPEVAEHEREHALDSARSHFAYAAQRIKPSRPQLILVCGVSGVGKTTVACELAKRLGAIHIRSDVVRKHLAGVPLHERSDAIYSDAITRRTYGRLADLASPLLDHGWTVVLDATYRRAAFRDEAQNRAANAGAGFRIVHLDAPIDVLKERIRARLEDVSDATPELIDAQIGEFEPFTTDEQPNVVEVNASETVAFDDLVSALHTPPRRHDVHD